MTCGAATLTELVLRTIKENRIPSDNLPRLFRNELENYYVNSALTTQILVQRHMQKHFPIPYYYALVRRIAHEMAIDSLLYNPFYCSQKYWTEACIVLSFPALLNIPSVHYEHINWTGVLVCVDVIRMLQNA